MRQNSIYRILEAVDLVEDTSLAEINNVLGEESSHDVQLVDTRFTVVGSKGPGYNGNISLFGRKSWKKEGKLESLLSSYTKEDEVTLNCVGGGFEHHYYEPVNL